MDIQLTDFENSALVVFLGMIVNIINEFSIDFVLPISKVDESMRLCQNQDALLKEKIWFRVDLFDHKQDYKMSKLKESDFKKSRVNSTSSSRVYKQLYLW